jgi:putative phage-type endonuclease
MKMLRVFNTIEQGSEEWFELRRGLLTASRFGDLLTMPRSKKDREAGKISKTTETYLIEKLTEILTGEHRELNSEALDWGTTNENKARQLYELERVCIIEQIGFASKGLIGCSPDGLVGNDGMIEIKCPYNSTYHTEYLLGGEISKHYYAQIQGNMMILDRQWCDFISFNPRVNDITKQLFIKRINRDEEFIKELKVAINIAKKYYIKLLKDMGVENNIEKRV